MTVAVIIHLTGSGNNSTSDNQKVQNPTQHGRTDELQ